MISRIRVGPALLVQGEGHHRRYLCLTFAVGATFAKLPCIAGSVQFVSFRRWLAGLTQWGAAGRQDMSRPDPWGQCAGASSASLRS
ncbi:hypothetical protein G6F22_022112 [Rhizopus arrhizus]|nr:hypothetical protein G6F22_022112 [Rhizopus arrhizus]